MERRGTELMDKSKNSFFKREISNQLACLKIVRANETDRFDALSSRYKIRVKIFPLRPRTTLNMCSQQASYRISNGTNVERYREVQPYKRSELCEILTRTVHPSVKYVLRCRRILTFEWRLRKQYATFIRIICLTFRGSGTKPEIRIVSGQWPRVCLR